MMGEEKVEYVPPAEYKVTSPLDYTKIIPGGVGSDPAVTEQFLKSNKAVEDYATALEDRFKNPNWYRIAAGFAKPQLGGFMASVGSAAEEAGRQQEAARAIAPAIARMRAETSAGQLGFVQRMSQKRMFDEIKAGRIPMNAETLQQLGELGTSTDIYKAAKDLFDTKQIALATQIEAQQAAAKYPYMDVGDFLQGSQKGKIEDQKQTLINLITAKGYHDPQSLKTMGVSELQNINSELQNQFVQKSLENAKTASELVDNSTLQLQNLSTARDLASSPRLQKLLGLESGNSAVSALFRWISSPTDEELSRLSTAARQLASKDPSAYADFQILQKSLATNLATAREGASNPSIPVQQLLAKTTPDPRMATEAIIKLLDLQANDINQNLNRARLMSSTRDAQGNFLDPNQIRQSPQYQSISKYANDRKKAILGGSFIDIRVPDFYRPYYDESPNTPTTQVPGQKTQTSATRATSSAPVISLDAIKSALEAKQKKP
jgi:hypothetical protein